jgi:hypothetical protein
VTASVNVIGPRRPPSAATLVRPLADALRRPATLILRCTQREEPITTFDGT